MAVEKAVKPERLRNDLLSEEFAESQLDWELKQSMSLSNKEKPQETDEKITQTLSWSQL